MGYEMHNKDDVYNVMLITGGRQNRYNNPGIGKPAPQGGTKYWHGNNHNNDEEEDDSDDDDIQYPVQSHPPQQGALQPAPAYYSIPYAYQRPPPPYPNHQLPLPEAGGGYHGGYHHAPGHPVSSFVSHLQGGGYGNHGGGGGHMNDTGLVGAALGLATFGLFQLMRDRRRRGERR